MFFKIKLWFDSHKREVIIFVLFFLVSTISFALGYLAANRREHAPIIIQKNSQ